MELQWICNGFAMDLQWICNGSEMDLRWISLALGILSIAQGFAHTTARSAHTAAPLVVGSVLGKLLQGSAHAAAPLALLVVPVWWCLSCPYPLAGAHHRWRQQEFVNGVASEARHVARACARSPDMLKWVIGLSLFSPTS